MSHSHPHILALETARDACSVAAIRTDGGVVSATTLIPRSHAEQLVPMAARVVEQASLTFDDIEAIAVSAGPGSYTGLRIGVSAAKGFAMAHGCRIIGVPTLLSYADSVARICRLRGLAADLIVVAIPARQTELYFGTFLPDPTGKSPDSVVEASIGDAADVAAQLSGLGGKIIRVAGDGADLLLQHVQSNDYVTSLPITPSAVAVGRIGLEKFARGHFEDTRTFEPYYLKDYVARQGGSVFDRLSI